MSRVTVVAVASVPRPFETGTAPTAPSNVTNVSSATAESGVSTTQAGSNNDEIFMGHLLKVAVSAEGTFWEPMFPGIAAMI
jgi:hypothetical protein